MDNNSEWSVPDKYLCFTFLAVMGSLGGFIRYVHEATQSRRAFTWLNLFFNTSMGGGLGVIFGMAAHRITPDHYLIFFIAGAAGAIGWPLIDMLTFAVRRRLQK